ncbi:MAG: Fmu (Sun) domain-containing protein, partial [Chitinophagaceae bacterium]
GIDFTELKKNALALPAAARLDEVIELNKEAVVQDYSSQGVGDLLEQALVKLREQPGGARRVWDCCAASGGKSIMAYDIDNSIRLTVSDIRASILINLLKRLRQAGISNYQSFVADLTEGSLQQVKPYDLIICDAPCTGSGTWGRTPEQLYFFEETAIQKYASLQQNILRTVIPTLRTDGYILYITCSVFKKENEDAVRYLEDNFPLELVSASLLKGYEMKADTMFAALLKKK